MTTSSDDIQEEFEEVLAESSWWSRFIGSQFVSFLSLFIARIVARYEAVAENALLESFLSLATNRASILAAAEDRAYVGLKISPSTGTATVTNTSDSRQTVSANTAVLSKGLVDYMLMDAIDLAAGASTEVEVQQLWLESSETTVGEQQDWLSVLLDQETTSYCHQLDVYVDDTQWEKRYKFRNTDGDSEVYMEYYKATEQLGVRFGNDTNGKSPETSSVIRLEAWCTEGETTLLDGQPLYFTGDNEDLNDSLTIETSSSITGGADGDDIESIRDGALYSNTYDEQLAWDGDYEQFISNSVGGLVWLSVWGEAEQEELDGAKDLSNINVIFISAYSDSKTSAELEEEILALFDDRNAYNETYQFVAPTMLPYTVTIDGIVNDSSDPDDAQTELESSLSSTYGIDAADKSSRVTLNELYGAVNDEKDDLGISEFVLTASDLPDSVPVNSYSYLDVDSSTITFAYEDV